MDKKSGLRIVYGNKIKAESKNEMAIVMTMCLAHFIFI